MSDLISRQDAMNAIQKRADEIDSVYSAFWEGLKIAQDIVEKVPSAELEEHEWCHDCKEYDQEKHCCHRWTKVIRNTVEEIKTKYWRWIPVTEALPEEKGEYLVSYHPCHWNTVSEKVLVGMDTFKGKTTWAKKKYQKVIAWMPLPEPWRGE